MRTKREVREKMEQLGFRVGQLVGNVHPFARVRSFDPGTLQIMGVALDSAWYKLLVSGSARPAEAGLRVPGALRPTREDERNCGLTRFARVRGANSQWPSHRHPVASRQQQRKGEAWRSHLAGVVRYGSYGGRGGAGRGVAVDPLLPNEATCTLCKTK
jgi:hypothetical protein